MNPGGQNGGDTEGRRWKRIIVIRMGELEMGVGGGGQARREGVTPGATQRDRGVVGDQWQREGGKGSEIHWVGVAGGHRAPAPAERKH